MKNIIIIFSLLISLFMLTNCSSDKEETQKGDKEEEEVYTDWEKKIFNKTGCHVKDAKQITEYHLFVSPNEERYLHGAKQNKFWFSKYTKEGDLLWEIINPTPSIKEEKKRTEYRSRAFNPVILCNKNIVAGCVYLNDGMQTTEVQPILILPDGKYQFVYNKEKYVYSNIDTFENFFICTISDQDMATIPSARYWYIQVSNDGEFISEGGEINPLYKTGTWLNDSEFIGANEQSVIKVDTKKGYSPQWSYLVELGEYKSYKSTTTIENTIANVVYEIERNNGEHESITHKLSINSGKKYTPITKISLGVTLFTIGINSEHKLNAATIPEDADLSTLIWESSDNGIATVENGILKGISEGNCIITVSNYEKTVSATCKVKVSNKSITIENNNIKMLPSYEVEIKYNVKPEGMQLKWKSSNENVATVNNGKVYAISKGTATITATSIEDEDIQGICYVSVVDIASMMDLKFQATSIINVGGYITGYISSFITNSSQEDITLTRFDVTDTETNQIVLYSDNISLLGSLKSKETKSFDTKLNRVYKPMFTWHFRYNGNDYKTSHTYQ